MKEFEKLQKAVVNTLSVHSCAYKMGEYRLENTEDNKDPRRVIVELVTKAGNACFVILDVIEKLKTELKGSKYRVTGVYVSQYETMNLNIKVELK